ncbi:MAG: hypothetical protein WBP58_00215 [Chitinophagaceae bacterium]
MFKLKIPLYQADYPLNEDIRETNKGNAEKKNITMLKTWKYTMNRVVGEAGLKSTILMVVVVPKL